MKMRRAMEQPDMDTIMVVKLLMKHPSLMISFPNSEDMPNAELLKEISSISLPELPAKLAELIASIQNPADATARGFEGSDHMYKNTASDVKNIDYDHPTASV